MTRVIETTRSEREDPRNPGELRDSYLAAGWNVANESNRLIILRYPLIPGTLLYIEKE